MYGNGRSVVFLLLILGLALGGCQPAAEPEPLPTANTVTVQITPALRWMAPLLNDCARRAGQGIVLDERPTRDLTPGQAALTLRWGAPPNLPAFAVDIGSDRLALAAHPSNPLSSLTREELTEIYAAAGAGWDGLDGAQENGPGGEIRNWGYANSEDIQQLIDSLVLAQPASAEASYLAPDPQALRQSVAADPAALGFVPAQLLDDSLKALQIEGLDAALEQPILALAASEPQGALRQFLGCVQEGVP